MCDPTVVVGAGCLVFVAGIATGAFVAAVRQDRRERELLARRARYTGNNRG